MNRHARRTVVSWICAAAVLLSASTALAIPIPTPTLWGVDEDDGELFSIADYTRIPDGAAAAGLVRYGKLKYIKDGHKVRSVGAHIEAFTLAPDGTAYMARNHDLDDATPDGHDVDEPVLMTYNIHDATTSGPNIVTVVGRINVPGYNRCRDDNISGLAIHPATGELYALWRRGNDDDYTDKLLVIDKTTGDVLADRGTITGLGERVGSGEDLEFDSDGNLYIVDNDDDHLYQVDPLTGNILAVLDHDLGNGRSVKYEGLAWDPESQRLVGSEDYHELFTILTMADGGNDELGDLCRLTDVEGIDFVPQEPTPLGETGNLQIVKFLDEDEDGERDASETLLAGWQFLVEGPANFSEWATTGPDGTVTLEDLAPGQYTVTETVQSGWFVTTPNPQYATVLFNDLAVVEFGNAPAGGGGEPIPEPGTASLLLLGLLAARRRRR